MYGNDINPQRSKRTLKAFKATRQHVSLTHNPSSIMPDQHLIIRFPNIGENDVIVPGSFYISFLLNLISAKDPARTVVSNVGRKIIKTLKIRFEGNEVLSIDNYDMIMSYFDMWLSKHQKQKLIFHGIQSESGLKLRVGTKDATGTADEVAISKTLGNRFRIPIHFELLNDIGPYYQYGLRDKLEIELISNNVASIIKASTANLASAVDSDYAYTITDIKTEWDQITHAELASDMNIQYSRLALPFTRILHHQMKVINKTEPVVNLNINVPSKSLTHILILTIDPEDRKNHQHNDVFKNLDIEKLMVIMEGKPNHLYASGMLKENTFDEIQKLFPDIDADVTIGEFLTSKYALCLDLRPSIDKTLHGAGLRLENTSEGLKIELHRTPASGGTGKLHLHIFLLQDAQLNIQGTRFNGIES